MDNKSIDPKKFLENFKQGSLTEAQEEVLMHSLFTENGAHEKQRILALHKKYQQQQLFVRRAVVYSGAAMLLCLAGFWFLRQSGGKPISNAPQAFALLVEKHSTAFRSRDKVLMGPPTPQNVTWEAAYDTLNYGKAIEILEKRQLSDTTKFYLGLCYLQNTPSQSQKAIKTWATIANPEYRQDEMKWWMALAYLRIDDKVQAKKALLSINAGDYKYSEAQILIAQLADYQ
jgi:hypothetical protein